MGHVVFVVCPFVGLTRRQLCRAVQRWTRHVPPLLRESSHFLHSQQNHSQKSFAYIAIAFTCKLDLVIVFLVIKSVFGTSPLTIMRRTNTHVLLWLILLTTESLITWVLILSHGCQSKVWFQHRLWGVGRLHRSCTRNRKYVWLVSKLCTGAHTERILHHWLMLSLTNLNIMMCYVVWLYLTSAVYLSFLTKCQTTSVSGFLVYWTSNLADISCVICNTGSVGSIWLVFCKK